jgi:N-acetylmuramoyl-L-alanine amidase
MYEQEIKITMNNRLTAVLIAIALIICAGCTNQDQSLSQVKSQTQIENKDDQSLSTNKYESSKTQSSSRSQKFNESKEVIGTQNNRSASKSQNADKSKASANIINKTQQNNKEKTSDKEKKPLAGLTICIDAGHGKTTRPAKEKEPLAPGSNIMKAATASGTSGVYTKITEESLNLSVALKLKKALSDKGAGVIMIRESSSCDLTNIERAKVWNSSGADLTIRLHGNGINDRSVSGVLMMVPGNKYIKDKEMLQRSETAGECILEGVLNQTNAKSRGLVKSTDLTGFNWSEIPVVLLEMGFMTNPHEDKLLNTAEYQNKIVSGIIEGLIKYKSKF